jgi:hypothetical protein
MSEYKIGDVVWIPVGGLRNVPVKCPICFGKLAVRLELGDGSMVELPCEYCAKGYEGPRGVVNEYTSDPTAEPFTITQIDRRETDAGASFEYHSHSGRYAKEVFATRDEAMARAVEIAAENMAEERKRADYIKHDKNKNYSWNAGYHRREAKRASEQVAYHTKMAELCRDRSKESKS